MFTRCTLVAINPSGEHSRRRAWQISQRQFVYRGTVADKQAFCRSINLVVLSIDNTAGEK